MSYATLLVGYVFVMNCDLITLGRQSDSNALPVGASNQLLGEEERENLMNGV